MTDTEKARRHLEKQNKRLRRLLWDSLTVGWSLLLTAAVFIGLGIKLKSARLQGPVQLAFGAYITKGGGRASKSVLITQSGEEYTIFHSVDIAKLREDQEAGRLQPGDPLTASWYPWLFGNKMIAAVSASTGAYGSLEDFEAARNQDANVCFWIGGIFIAIRLFLAAWIFLGSRKEIAEIRRLRGKYREQLKQ